MESLEVGVALGKDEGAERLPQADVVYGERLCGTRRRGAWDGNF